MGSYMNFKNFGDTVQPDGSGGKPVGNNNIPLARQSSIYSLTFDEFQNTLGGFGKEFGSMNMDELLKNICTAEETQVMASSSGGGEGSLPIGNLQRQGSLTLPRTLSQRTVDEVWRDLLKEDNGVNDGGSGNGGSSLPQRQATLGEMTLEEFLVRAGVVREDVQPTGGKINGGFYGEISGTKSNNTGLALGFQHTGQNLGGLGNQVTGNGNTLPGTCSNIALNTVGLGTSQQLLQQPQQQLPPPLFPKPANVAFGSSMHIVNNSQLAIQGKKAPIAARQEPLVSHGLVQGGFMQSGAMGMADFSTGATNIAGGTPANRLPSDRIARNNLDASSLSPSPRVFDEGSHGRKCSNTLEKVVERRRKRMIKNRESAARSRARKQAYTLELEAEIVKLKEVNQELQEKQAEIMEIQKTQVLECRNMPWGGQKLCLRRTLTGPW